MKKGSLLLVSIVSIVLLVWYTGLLTLSYHALVLSIAFLAEYLTPGKYATLPIDHAWKQWWQVGQAARWVQYQQDASLQQSTQDYALFIGVSLAGAIFLFIPWQTVRLKASTVHGSAHWATLREARPFLAARGKKMESHLPLGTYKGRSLSLQEKTIEEHVLIVGPSGKGKTAGIIAPGILSERGNRSLVIIDPKQELVTLTAGAVARFLDIRLFAPLEPEKSQRYNPLAHIQTKKDAEAFAECWVSNTGRSNSDPFWDRCAETLITSVVLHLRATEPEASFSRLVELLCSSSFEELDAVLTSSLSPHVQKSAAAFMKNLKLNEKTAGGVMTDVAGRFARFSGDPLLEAVTSRDEMDFSAMVQSARRSIALYIAIPAEEAPLLKPLTACLLMQMFKAFIQGTHEKGVTCYLDEFANAGTIPLMSEYITMLRSRRVGLLMAIQNHSQLDARYGKDDADTIKSNASTHIVLPGAGQSEAEFYSRRIGDTTVIGQSVSNSARARNATTNQAQQETARKLIMPEEIRTMKKGEMLLLSDTIAPIKFQNIPYYRDRTLARLVNLPLPGTDEEQKRKESLLSLEEERVVTHQQASGDDERKEVLFIPRPERQPEDVSEEQEPQPPFHFQE